MSVCAGQTKLTWQLSDCWQWLVSRSDSTKWLHPSPSVRAPLCSTRFACSSSMQQAEWTFLCAAGKNEYFGMVLCGTIALMAMPKHQHWTVLILIIDQAPCLCAYMFQQVFELATALRSRNSWCDLALLLRYIPQLAFFTSLVRLATSQPYTAGSNWWML